MAPVKPQIPLFGRTAAARRPGYPLQQKTHFSRMKFAPSNRVRGAQTPDPVRVFCSAPIPCAAEKCKALFCLTAPCVSPPGAAFRSLIKHWTCETTRLVVSQVSQIWRIFCRNPPNLLFFSGSCSITEVIEQLY
jgi:hypothetical protein